MAHAAPSICEDTHRLDEEIMVSDLARSIVLEKLPYGENHRTAVRKQDYYYFPEKTTQHNQEMILLACTLLGEDKLDEDQRHAQQQLVGELANRLRGIPRPSPDGTNADTIQQEVNHAWELVYHWHHVLLGSGVAQPVPEKELYLPALEAFGRSGKVQRLPHVLGNPKTARVLFPDLYQHMRKKDQERELRLMAFERNEGDSVKKIMAYVVQEVQSLPSTDIRDHERPQVGEWTPDHKLFIGFLIPLCTLLGPYLALGLITALISDIKQRRPIFSSAHDFLVGMQALPEINPDLSENEQAQITAIRLKVIGVLSVTLPALGIAAIAMSQQA